MPGLNLHVMGGVTANGGNGMSPTVSSGASATSKAFGQAYTDSGSPSTASALAPNDAFGVAFWGGVTAVFLLIALRHSLPA